ncbi:hypothetical protein Lal_00032211 [Lupinus albus]|nr:hypothetical protein Lal_00032211 [Lupinus albus]
MEKRMQSGKFVEGPEASTTVKESFTHPRNHIPIPEVSIDISVEDDALVLIPTDEDITTVREVVATFLACPEHLIDVIPIMGKVSTDNHSATSPPTIDEPASKKAKVVKSKPQTSKSNLDLLGEVAPQKTKYFEILWDYVQNSSGDSTIKISFPSPIYGFYADEFIGINEVKDVYDRD